MDDGLNTCVGMMSLSLLRQWNFKSISLKILQFFIGLKLDGNKRRYGVGDWWYSADLNVALAYSFFDELPCWLPCRLGIPFHNQDHSIVHTVLVHGSGDVVCACACGQEGAGPLCWPVSTPSVGSRLA